MPCEWRITSDPIDGDIEPWTPEQISVINRLTAILDLEDFDTSEYELGRIQADRLIDDLHDVIQSRMGRQHHVEPQQSKSLGSSLFKAMLFVTGVGFAISILDDDCDE